MPIIPPLRIIAISTGERETAAAAVAARARGRSGVEGGGEMAKYGVPPSTDRPNERATNLAPLLPPRIECAIHSRQRGRRSKRMRMHMPFLQVHGRAEGGGGRLGRLADGRGLSVYGVPTS